MDQVDRAEHCKYAKKSLKKRLLERVRAPNSAAFRISSQIVQRECPSHRVHWTVTTGRTLLYLTSVAFALPQREIMGVPKGSQAEAEAE